MTEEEKELLLKDLCARLPYGIKCYYNSPEIDDDVPDGISVIKGFQNEGILVEIESGDVIDIDYVKPYLRPMSSITEEEQEHCGDLILHREDWMSYYDYLDSRLLDYRGLIEKGLALEASEGIYNLN